MRSTALSLVIAFLATAFLSEQAAAQADYFQQTVDHQIAVALDDAEHTLRGDIATRYTNNSADTLDFLWIHLWPNAYKNGQTALAQQKFRQGEMFMFWALQRDLGGIDSLDFAVDGVAAEWAYHPEHIDIAKLTLPKPLVPGESLEYATPFRVQLPSGKISRLGHIGESYQITQWYPKPAVYDRDGWHEMPYLNQGEFYSEFGSFDVKITLPKNYVVGATGDFDPSWSHNQKEEVFLDSIALATARRIDATEFDDLELNPDSVNAFPVSATETKTLRYRQYNVHDFAWFADKRWWVLKGSTELPWSGREVTTWSMFTPAEAKLWRKAPEYIADATRYYSQWNGDYPYEQVTAVDGTISAGGGMEYPNVTVIGSSGSDMGLETVIVHEVGHNWFYGILGSNERTNAWMDEGINSFNETRYFVEKYGDAIGLTGMVEEATPIMERLDLIGRSYESRDALAYLLSARMSDDQPMQCHSDAFSGINYGTVVYKKSAAAFEYLRQSLGTPQFDAAMRSYFSEWKFKHPGPDDLQRSLEASTRKDLAWFFDGLIPTTGQTDYAIAGLRRERTADGDTLVVSVRNRGDLEGPWPLYGCVADSVWKRIEWYNPIDAGSAGNLRIAATDRNGSPYTALRIDHENVSMDAHPQNNTIRTSGLLRKIEPVTLRLLTRLEDGSRTQLNWLPAVAWNRCDGFLAGFAIHNSVLPLRDWEWMAMPLWSTNRSQLAGVGRASFKKGKGRWEVQVRKFATEGIESVYNVDFLRSSLGYTHRFNRNPGNPLKSTLSLALIDVRERAQGIGIDPGFAPQPDFTRQAFRLNYSIVHQRGNVKQSGEVRVTAAGAETLLSAYGHSKPSFFGSPILPELIDQSIALEAIWRGRVEVNRKGRGWDWRVYAGKSFGSVWVYPLMSAGITGDKDNLKDHVFLGRNSFGLLSRIIARQQGGLTMMDVPYSSNSDEIQTRVDQMVSARISRDLTKRISVYGGGLIGTGVELASVGLEMNLSFVKLQLPVAQWLNGFTTFNFNGRTAFGIVLNLEDLSPYQLLRSGRLLN
ncbi:MAG: M1 family metallopeptidase [Flavobacteriales bacterium]|nr:M1 family metallopeptidase [Flavobacteriales bacterium]